MEYTTYTLPNGLRMIHMPAQSPVAYCGYAVNAGARDEEPQEHGLAHFVEHMIFKGTEHHKANYILNRIESVGGELNAYTTKEETFVYSIFMKEHFLRAFDLLTDLVFYSSFPEIEIEKEKDVILDEISSYEDSPSELIFDDFENLLYKEHALGHNILGEEETLERFSTTTGKSFMNHYYTPGNMVFFSMGDIPFNKIVKWAESLFSTLPAHSSPQKRKVPTLSSASSLTMSKETHQAHVMIGSHAFSMFDEKRIPMFLLNNIIGGPGMNNRLNVSLREHNGLVYSVESNITSYTDTGLFSIYFGTDPKNKEKAIRIVHREIEKLHETKLTEKQLTAAKKQALGQLGVSIDNREGLFLNMGKSFLHYNFFASMEEVFNQINDITAEGILDIAQTVLAPDKLFMLSYD